MKKLFSIICLIGLFSFGCASYSEFMSHDSMYASWDHAKFSVYGHTNPDVQDCEKSKAQNWWGEEYECCR